MDDHTMFGSIKENALDFLVTNEMSSHDGWLEVPNLSSSTPFDFSSSYLHSSDDFLRLSPNLCQSHFEDQTDMEPLDDCHTFFDNRLTQAIQHLNTTDTDNLIQLWLPAIRHGKRVLTTDNKPFIINPENRNLSNYREVSKIYQFAAEDDSTEMIGLPSRVFFKKFPLCTPDFQFVGEEHDPRVTHAQKLNLCGCLSFPVFELEGATCLGVIEVVTTSQKVNFRNELENICKALEAVDLRSCEFLIHPKLLDSGDPYQVALAEIRDALRSICETLNLPLAQTWSPCKGRSLQPVACISIIESASYVFDPQILGFYEACCEQQLVQGEGIAGKALGTNQPCFTADIADFCRAEYPLVHEARMFGLSGAVAIRLGSTYTGLMDFILELFLPRDCKGDEEQKQMLSSIASMIQHVSWSFHVINDKEEAEATSFSVKETYTRDDSWISHMLEAQKRGETVIVSMGCHKEEPEEEFKVINQFYHGKQTKSKGGSSEKSQVKTQRNISLKVLQKYFPGSLKDAAKSLGVCPTTLKRICRQRGIVRWPSRKIKKVGRSLKKLQLVIDSVQGAEGTIQLGSFYTNFPVPPSSPRPKVNLLKKSQTTASNSSSSSTGGLQKVLVVSEDEHVLRVKVAFGEEKIRFRMSRHWGFGDLQGEITRRFNMYDMSNATLEYLDDELEWVLLACDADLEECMDLHISTKNRTIRLFLHRPALPLPIVHPSHNIHMW